MSCKFLKIDELPADCYNIWFNIDGKKLNIFTQGIENLMMGVLNEDNYNGPSEWELWCKDGSLPNVYGPVDGEVEFAEEYFQANEESYAVAFE